MEKKLTVGLLAELAGVTVRTLHHYDEIGLVVPSGRTEAGYRTYGSAEVERLQEVLFYRELGFSLDAIQEMVSRPGYDRAAALEQQRYLLERKADHLFAMIDAVDRAIVAHRNGVKMANEDMLEVFGDFDPAEYEEEAKERWGETDAFKQSAQRTAGYGKAEWQAIKDESEGIYRSFGELMAAGISAEDARAMDVAEQHRAHISRWFYDCPVEMHAGLGQMYVADVRFQENIDKHGKGLAEYMAGAIAANAAR
jgi:DNA-binding transcriptional MerR regulator